MWASSLFECEKSYMFAPEATCEDFIFQIHVLIHVGLPMFTRESFPTAMLVPHRHVVFQDEFALLRFFFHHKHHKQVTWNMYMFFQVWDVLPNDYKFWTLLKPQVSSNKITTCLRASGKFWTCRATSPQKTSNKTCLLRRVDDKTTRPMAFEGTVGGIWRRNLGGDGGPNMDTVMGDTGDHRLPQGMTILYGENMGKWWQSPGYWGAEFLYKNQVQL